MVQTNALAVLDQNTRVIPNEATAPKSPVPTEQLPTNLVANYCFTLHSSQVSCRSNQCLNNTHSKTAMLAIATVAISCLLLFLAIAQAIYVIRYQQFLASDPINEGHQETKLQPDTDDIPRAVTGQAAILLCLRGVDPSLSECLKGIARQDYEDFQVHIVFDHPDDPAVAFVRNFFANQSLQPVLHFNTSPPKTCSLKCSSLVAAIEALPQEIEFVALIDADTAADKNWLIDLLAPFADPSVGATTGNRWFTPSESNFGTVFRKVWNSAAVPHVVLYNIG